MCEKVVKKFFTYIGRKKKNFQKKIKKEADTMARTPQEFTKNIKKGIITKEMLVEALYSVNKRAKNFRDKRWAYMAYDGPYYEIANEKKEEYYRMKDILLQMLTPTCIHEETQFRYPKVYDYEPEYNNYSDEEIERRGSYYEYMEDKRVHFIVLKREVKKYYLFYDMGNHSFHTPIPSPDAYPDLEVVEIGSLVTHGADVNDLMSPQFVRKIIALFESGNYELQLE